MVSPSDRYMEWGDEMTRKDAVRLLQIIMASYPDRNFLYVGNQQNATIVAGVLEHNGYQTVVLDRKSNEPGIKVMFD